MQAVVCTQSACPQGFTHCAQGFCLLPGALDSGIAAEQLCASFVTKSFDNRSCKRVVADSLCNKGGECMRPLAAFEP